MQMDHADGTAMVSDDRLMMIRVCKRQGAEEREPGGYCYCRKFHDLVVRVVCTNSKWTFYLVVPLKLSLMGDGSLSVGSRINPQRGHQA
jgi:hypothetical protein